MAHTEPWSYDEWFFNEPYEPIEDDWWDMIEAQDRRAEDGMYDDQ